MKSVIADSPSDVVRGLLEFLADHPPRHFVDFGCGRGRVLTAVARAYPDVPCVGIDMDADGISVTMEQVRHSALKNVSFIRGDVLDHVDVAADVAYLYLGGALNQRLGHALLDRKLCGTVLAARYPVAGAAPTEVTALGDSSLYRYDRECVATAVEWDSAGTCLQLPQGSRYLLSKAMRFNTTGRLVSVTRHMTSKSDARIVGTEFGFPSASTGLPIVCDFLLQADRISIASPTVINISVECDGVALNPSHTLVVVVAEDTERPQELSLASEHHVARVLEQFRAKGQVA
jgi:SAM-dependent methyltransferase